ncbi:helix-turn-helix domain-containing protein [Lentzea sp. NPDC058450]|uniref:helix-turn-helix domain-containing protein n=1 Tax=Lentzea sp. NPDC058450 TaxID=3346505 RepID=UPI00364E6A6F
MTEEHKTAEGLLRRLRSSQGRSLRTASDDLGLAPSHLSRLERGERRATPEIAEKLANYYGVSSDLVALDEGRIPDDVVRILQEHPEEMDLLRARYGETRGA